MSNTRQWLSIKELSEYAGISRNALLEVLARDDDPLPAYRMKEGAKWRISRDDFDRWMRKQESTR